MKKIMLCLANGFEEIEALAVVDILRRANVICDMLSLDNMYVNGAHNIQIKADKLINEVNASEYDGIVLPGGLPGADTLRDSKDVISIVKDFSSNGKLVAAICAAPKVLVKAEVVNGKEITSYPSSIDANNTSYNYKENPVVVDGNIITSRGPATAMLFAYEILNFLGYSKESKELREGMMYNII